MGDRGNIVILDGEAPPLFLYTHWGGSDLVSSAAAGLRRAPDRWDDPSYLARNVFCAMGADRDGSTGFGVATWPPDNQRPYLVLDANGVAYTVDLDGGPWTAERFRSAVRLREWTYAALAAESAP